MLMLVVLLDEVAEEAEDDAPPRDWKPDVDLKISS